jgi:SAM-dependent methyltransferase
MTAVRQVSGRERALRALARYVAGNGVELGPGHAPFSLPYPATTVRYVDRWKPDENRQLFPELGDDANFPMPDIVADLNVDRLSMLADESQDFVIASHLLEHLVDPLAHLAEIHRVLRPGGVVIIMLPDRRLTFDRNRDATTLEHLIADHATGSRTVDDEHLEEFLRGTGDWDEAWDATERAAQFDLHRQRSIHVHCWTQEEFLPVVRYSVTDMGLSWELLDALFYEDVPGSIEFGLVLRRSLSAGDFSALGRRLEGVWYELVENHRRSRGIAGEVAAVRGELERIRNHPAFRVASQLRHRARTAMLAPARLRRRSS